VVDLRRAAKERDGPLPSIAVADSLRAEGEVLMAPRGPMLVAPRIDAVGATHTAAAAALTLLRDCDQNG
jgi:hypothetical protein